MSEGMEDYAQWEALRVGVVWCDDCGEEPADLPSKLCPGCAAYREHTGGI